MKKTRLLIILGLVLLVLTGCSSRSNSIASIGVNDISLAPLQQSQYDVVGNITGTAEVTTFLGFPINGSNDSGAIENPVLGMLPNITFNVAKERAIFNAIASNEDVDAVICPKFHIEKSGIPILMRTTKVTVKAKGIKIK